ncbi:MAG TPA: UPF0182 family protein [Blastocatellia bacterium]|nr:UPF0182 family protein [Blastocatellia bacterium]
MEDDPLFNKKVIDVNPPRRRRLWLLVLIAAVVVVLLAGSNVLHVYVEALWFNSVGFSSVYWYKFRLGALLFVVFFTLTFAIIKLAFWLLNRLFPELTERPRLRLTAVEDIREVNFLPFIYRPGVWVLAAGGGLLAGVQMSQEWPEFALFLNSQSAGATDPIFNRDASFYLFRLPVYDLLTGWWQTIAILLFIVIAAAAAYVWYLERVRNEVRTQTRRRATIAVSAAGAFAALSLAASTYLDRFEMFDHHHDFFTGINYIDANVRLKAMNVLVLMLALSAVALIINAIALRQLRMVWWLAALIVVTAVVGLGIIPQSVQSISVKPNELAKESIYLEYNINKTREAFALDRFEEDRHTVPAVMPTAQQIRANAETLDNVRLWDRRALQATLGQIQQIRPYYDFRTPDVDRYVLNGRLRQVMLAAREMNVEQLPEPSRNWINQHLVYTHGYGVTMNTVNEFTPEGQPHLVLKNMPVESDAPEVKVTRPEIYFGEDSTMHVYVNTTQPEFNYPAPDDTDAHAAYEGGAGIAVGGFFRKLALSWYLGDGSNLLFSDYINGGSRVLLHREVRDRVARIAPFLMFDDDPYIVINREGRLFWMIDGFTVSDRYPYATAYDVGGRRVNYIRNSVKAVVDAYDGAVTFYVFEPNDPIIQVYRRIFPALFRAADEMPDDLRAHVRYPSLLVNAQAQAYLLYHMTNPQTFYNHEDLWAIAASEAPVKQGQEPEPMQPYHVLMQLPGESNVPLEFLNILPFTPSGNRSNMIGWLAARNDGANYGKVVVYSFPKNVTVNGPAQIRARINQDPQLSQLMTLWSQRGSELLRGNLLVIPLADSLLYVEAFYLQAEGQQSKLPELRQVAIATQDRLAYGRTFDEALRALFPEIGPSAKPATPSAPAAQPAAPPQQAAKPAAPATPAGDEARLIQQAAQLLADYERLTAEGKHREAGEKLDQLKQTLGELKRLRGGQ